MIQAYLYNFKFLAFSFVSVCLDEIETYKHKSRRRLYDEEKSVLKQSFAENLYPTMETIRNLSKTLGFSTLRVNNWFNYERRKKNKTQVSEPCKLMIS